MKSVYIAQPIKDIPKDEVGAVRMGIISKLNEGLPIEDQYMLHEGDTYLEPGESELMHLGRAIVDVSMVDYVVFAPGWENDPECQAIWTICNVYDLKWFEFDKVYL